MSAPRTARQVARHRQMAAAARELFLEFGYAGTSMDAVAAKAKVSKQTLYAYFPTKVDLLRDMLTAELPEFAPPASGAAAPDSLAALRTVLLQFATRLTQTLLHPDALAVIRLVLGEAFRIPELRDTVRDTVPLRALHGIAAMVARADGLGLIAAPNPDLAARMLLGPLMTYVAIDGFLRTDAGAVQPPPADHLEQIVDAFLTTVKVGS